LIWSPTVSRSEMSLRRMGLPEEGIHLWCRHDQSRRQHVRTAYGLTQYPGDGVHPRAGAFGQGAEESPMGFTSLISWKCDFIDAAIAGKRVGYPCHIAANTTVDISKTLFCDDSSYSSRSMAGAQLLTDLIGEFVAATGMQLNLKKSFWTNMNLRTTASLTIPLYTVNKAAVSKKRTTTKRD
jgi:hypothetical protein